MLASFSLEDEMSRTETDARSSKQQFHAEIDEDHQALKELLSQLEETTDLQLLLSLLQRLRSQLLEHYEREESPEGLHEVISSLAPSQVATLQNVLGEHREILKRLDDLDRQVQECLEGPVAEVRRATDGLLEFLHDHEARESALFTEAVFTDLGRSS